MFFQNLKIIIVVRNQISTLYFSYNKDFTSNAGNYFIKMREIKSTLYSYLTNKMWKLRF